jgi:exosortase D (VPLPA-CTERM-specific)
VTIVVVLRLFVTKMVTTANDFSERWKVPPTGWLVVGAVAALLVVAFFSGLRDLMQVWETQEEYSFGYMIPFVTLYLLWQKRGSLMAISFSGSWVGTVLVLLALLLLWIGKLATLGTIVQYAFLMSVVGLTLSYTGWSAFRVIAMPLVILAFMVPLPNYFLRELSQVLQLLSSQIGVLIIRAFGISVYLEGNVIDLGALKLQVVEACSGLRYLIPLMAIGFIACYLFRAPFWKRAVLFLSTIPITVLMNSVRIGLIGILVEYFGKSMAEGFLHDFEGWVVFMVCTGILIVEILLLAKIGNPGARLSDVFLLESAVLEKNGQAHQRKLTLSFMVAAGLVTIAAIAIQLMPSPVYELPQRKSFSEFPLSVGEWRGTLDQIAPEYLQLLQLDDYVLADFSSRTNASANFYVSYYATQANGNSAHSPRACIPGDGWEIVDFKDRENSRVIVNGQSLRFNRVVIRKGENRQLVYYWFQQRGRISTNEYVVKLQVFWDAITRHRTDGAMVRLVTRLGPGESDEVGDRVLEDFAKVVVSELESYIPE